MSESAWEARALRGARWLAAASGVLLLAITLVMVCDAALRYGFSRPISASVELVEQLLGVAMFMALPLVELTDSHVKVDSLAARLGTKGKLAALALGSAVMFVLLAAIAWQMSQLLSEMIRTQRVTITARIPVAPFLATALVCTVSASIASLLKGFIALKQLFLRRAEGLP